MDFQFLGGASEVGRLGMVLKKGPISLLFDYGLLPRDPPQYPIPAPPVDGMFVSHAHLDHTGMIPWVTRRQDLDVVLTPPRSEEHTSELQSHGLISYAVFCLKKK